jgi:L-alanine-DL-glutamate epimerase-like enolase superfamily enzyme
MSRIAAVDAFCLERPADALSPRAEHCFLLRLVTEDGLTGWGEGHGSPYVMRAAIEAPVTHASAQGLAHLLLGAEAGDIPALRHRLDRGTQWIGRDGAVAQAIAAAELALWDLAGQRAGQPVAKLLADAPARDVRAYASGKVAATPAATHARLAAERAAGFDAFKIGWPPFGADADADCAYLDAARDAIGARDLMLDAAQAWDAATAAERARRFAAYRLGWIEEPLDRDDLAGQAALRAQRLTPIAAGEGECGLPGLKRLLDHGCVDVLQPDVTRCGLLAALQAARLAQAEGLAVASHSFTTALNVTAHLHLLAALPGALLLEWPVRPLLIWNELFPGAPRVTGGRVAVPDAPGWGLAPDPIALRRWALAEGSARQPGWGGR